MSTSNNSAQGALSKKIKKGSGKGFDAEKLRRAEQTLQDAISGFGSNARDELETMMSHMRDLRDSDLDEDSKIKALERLSMVAHELRGQGGTFGYQLLTSVCASMYYFAKAVDLGNARQLDVLELHAESVRLILIEQMSGDGGDKGGELLQGLKDAVEKVTE